MDAQAIEKITELARRSVEPKFAPFDSTRPAAYVGADGELKITVASAGPRRSVARSVETIVDFAKVGGFTDPEIWFGRSGIVLIDQARMDRIEMPLELSAQMKTLVELDKSKRHISQRDLLYMLRTVFGASAIRDGATGFAASIRAMKFTTAAEKGSEIERGKSSVGKSLRAEASGVGEIPENVTLYVPVFDHPDFNTERAVTCAVEICEEQQTFQFFPRPGMIERAMALAESEVEQAIIDKLDGFEIPVFNGVP